MITRAGNLVAAIIDVGLFKRVRKLDEEFANMADELANAFADVPEEKGMTLVDEAVRATRRKLNKGGWRLTRTY
jgi:hypothetical protein